MEKISFIPGCDDMEAPGITLRDYIEAYNELLDEKTEYEHCICVLRKSQSILHEEIAKDTRKPVQHMYAQLCIVNKKIENLLNTCVIEETK